MAVARASRRHKRYHPSQAQHSFITPRTTPEDAMRTRRLGQAAARVTGGLRALIVAFAGVVVLLAGLGFLLAPAAPAAAQPPAQGWTTTEAPLPNDAGNGSTSPEVYTAGSSCPAANACVMAGWYLDDSSAQRAWGLIENQNGTNWTETRAPQPNNAGTGTKQGLRIGAADCGGQLPCRPLSCPTVTFCVAVGQFNDSGGSSGYPEPLIETYANGIWTATQSPLPSDAATDSGPSFFPDAWLFSVSCGTPTSCAAVGEYQTTSGTRVGFLATLSGTAWTAEPVPFPAGSGASLPISSGSRARQRDPAPPPAATKTPTAQRTAIDRSARQRHVDVDTGARADQRRERHGRGPVRRSLPGFVFGLQLRRRRRVRGHLGQHPFTDRLVEREHLDTVAGSAAAERDCP